MMDPSRTWLYQKWADQTIQNLRRNNMEGFYFASGQDAAASIVDHIPREAIVGLGDSLTLQQIGVISRLEKAGYRILNPWAARDAKEKLDLQRQIFTSHVFLVGSNAITLTGELINMDGRGNRVAAMIFGPEKVIVVVGVNKIVRDVEEGLERIRRVAGPANAKRHDFPKESRPPCAETGFCSHCKPPISICACYAVIRGQRLDQGRIKVFIIGEELGL
jgi:hypothetical protein